MTDEKPRRFVLRRNPESDSTNTGEFASGESQSHGPWTEFTVPGHFAANELEVTITPRKTKRERRAEVLRQLIDSVPKTSFPHALLSKYLDTLEAIDRGDG